jgi:hypothetical protein
LHSYRVASENLVVRDERSIFAYCLPDHQVIERIAMMFGHPGQRRKMCGPDCQAREIAPYEASFKRSHIGAKFANAKFYHSLPNRHQR